MTPTLLVVTDRHGSPRPLVETVRACLDGGAGFVWLRERDMDPPEREGLARDLLALVRGAGGRLMLGGDPAQARALGADGVHLPGASPEAIPARVAVARAVLGSGLVGLSAHGLAEVRAAAGAGADYVTLSPVFPSASKPGYGPALGLETLRAACALGVPVLALGGIDPEGARACRAAGAAGVAVMGAVMRAGDPAARTRAFLAALE